MRFSSRCGLTERALIARKFTLGTCAIIRIAADATDIVVWHVPAPRSHSIPLFDSDLHSNFNRVRHKMVAIRVRRNKSKQRWQINWQITADYEAVKQAAEK